MRFLTGLFAVSLVFGFLLDDTKAGPKTKRGVCRAILPTSASLIGKNRYRVNYRSMYSLRKFYRKVFGRRNPRIRTIKLLALPRVVVYHIKNLRKSSRWSGLNLTLYRGKGKIEVFVICRK